VTLDDRGRAFFRPSATGLIHLVGTATDLDGFVGRVEKTLKVRDPNDVDSPVVQLDLSLAGRSLEVPTSIVGTVNDSNLESWQLGIARFGSNAFTIIAQGTTTFANSAIHLLDPAAYQNGIWQLRLTAADITGRTAESDTTVEMNSV